jgi:hypothetical protein
MYHVSHVVGIRKILIDKMSTESRGRNSVVECQLPKLDVVGSNPIARYTLFLKHGQSRIDV